MSCGVTVTVGGKPAQKLTDVSRVSVTGQTQFQSLIPSL